MKKIRQEMIELGMDPDAPIELPTLEGLNLDELTSKP